MQPDHWYQGWGREEEGECSGLNCMKKVGVPVDEEGECQFRVGERRRHEDGMNGTKQS